MMSQTNRLKDAWLKFNNSQGEAQEDLLKIVSTYKDQWLSDRQATQDKKWRQSRAFYAGNHYVRSHAPSGPHKVRLKENHINNTLLRIQSIFVQNMPIVRVFPNSINYKDVQDAETTEAYMKMYATQNKFDIKFAKLVKLGCMYGNGFSYRYFDPDARGIMNFDNENDEGTSNISYRGDIKTKIESPFRYCFRPGIYEMEDHYDFIRFEPAVRQDLEAKYGKLDAEPARILSTGSGQVRIDEDVVLKCEYWHKPTSWFESGLYVCWAGNKILKAMEWPFEDKVGNKKIEMPVSHLVFDDVDESFWGLSTIEQVIDLQEQLNKAASMIVEARNLMARPRAIVANESKMPNQSITDRPGDVYRYAKDGGKPEFIVSNFNFSELAANKSDLREAIGAVSGVTSASRGEIPANVKTASALQMVLEQDRSQFVPMIKRAHSVWHEQNYGVASMSAQFISEDDPRVIKLESVYGAARMFHGGIVPSPLDMTLEDTNPLGWTAASRQENVGTFIDKGLITDQTTALEMLQLNLPSPALDYVKINRQSAQQEIQQMNNMIPMETGVADRHETHLEEHNKFISSFSFRSLPPSVQDLHIKHRQEHLDALAMSAPPPEGGDVNAGAPPPVDAVDPLAPPLPGGEDPILAA